MQKLLTSLILAPLTNNLNPNIYYMGFPWDGQTAIYLAVSNGHTDIVKALAPLTDNPNADGRTPILTTAFKGHTEIVKILAPLTDNPNAPDEDGDTPIIRIVVKILAPLTDNPKGPRF